MTKVNGIITAAFRLAKIRPTSNYGGEKAPRSQLIPLVDTVERARQLSLARVISTDTNGVEQCRTAPPRRTKSRDSSVVIGR